MATALQQQLAQIAANSTHQLDLKAQKVRHGKSLLFEPSVAASQSFDTIFQICWEGFSELCQLDARFTPFTRTLFSEQSKSEDRTQMTAAENRELDSVVEKFLGLLSGRLLLRPAMKAAEWLVRRFRVQEYNTQMVLLTFLPYHSSPIFPTLLSILPEQLPVTFRFLHPYVTSLQCPPRAAVVNAMAGATNLMTVFSNFVISTAKARNHAALVLGFWASAVAQAVNTMIDSTRSGREAVRRQKEEDLLLKALPVLQSALSTPNVPELYLGSCMIVTIIATKASLSDKVIDALMHAVATTTWTAQTLPEGLMCLAVLAEERSEPSLPKPVVKAVLDEDTILTTLVRVGQQCRISAFVTALLQTVIKAPSESTTKLSAPALYELSQSLRFSGDLQAYLIDACITATSPESKEIAKSIGNIILTSSSSSRMLSEAARRNGVVVGAVRDLLGISQHVVSNATDVTAEMDLDEEKETTADSSDADLAVLTKVPLQHGTSYLRLSTEATYVESAAALRRLAESSTPSSRITNLFETDSENGDVPVMTFLARLWSSDTSIKTQIKALDLAKVFVQHATNTSDSDRVIGLQSLLPYCLTALAHAEKAVRRAAIALVRVLVKERGAAKNSCPALYGQKDDTAHWLSAVSLSTFVSDGLLSLLDDCLLDGEFIVKGLSDLLNADSTNVKTVRKELNSSVRSDVAAFFIGQATIVAIPTVQLTLLDVVAKLGKVASSSRVKILLPYTRHSISGSLVDARLRDALLKCVTHRTTDEIALLQDIAIGKLSKDTHTIVSAFKRLQSIWRRLPATVQTNTADWLVDLSTNSEALDDVQTEATETFKTLSFSSETLVHLLHTLPRITDAQDHATPAKRRRTSLTAEIVRLGDDDKAKINLAMRRLTMVLEVIEQSNPEKHPPLLKELFNLMGDMHIYKAKSGSELVYLQGLIINSLLAVVNGLSTANNKDIDRSVIRADLIVECVRTTSSTQVHHAALLLMSALASWAPELVLHSVMPLFTFMSSTILKQSDDFSAHVTEQTVTQIIPPLAASLKRNGKDLITGAADLLLSFTAAFEHIPLHRRGGIFKHLVQTLGPDQALFAVVAMLIERYPESSTVLPFVNDLMAAFPVHTQMAALKQYLALVFETTKLKKPLPDTILGFTEKSPEEMEDSRSALLDGLAHILARDAFRKQVVKHLRLGGDEADRVRSMYADLLQQSMDLTQLLSSDADSEGRTSADDVLTALLGVLPTADFIDSSALLMQAGSDEMRRQVFASLEQRVSEAKSGNALMQKVFIDVLPNCAAFLVASQPALTRRAAITCIDQISEKFGKTDRDATLEAAKHIAGPAALGSDVDYLQVTSLLCLASMVEVLVDEMVPILPTVLDAAVEFLTKTLQSDSPDPSLHRAAYSFAVAVVDYVPWIMSKRHVDQLLLLAAQSNALGNHAVDVELSRQFCSLVARKVPAQDNLSAIDRIWDETVAFGHTASLQLLNMFQLVVQTNTKSTISKHAQKIFAVLLRAFSLRSVLPDSPDGDESPADITEAVNKVAMDVVLKLNDATFRPFFLRLVDWTSEVKSSSASSEALLRSTSLYSFATTFFDQLKSLVTSYATYLLPNAVEILKSAPPTIDLARELRTLILRSLTVSFQHDQDSFWQSPTHFDAIAYPLLILLKQAKTQAVDHDVIPAITELAAAAGSPEHYKTMNTLIMSYMRHEHAAVRLAAVKCERAITERLGLDWLALLPEMLPFISELQEDDDEAVEREVLRWNAQIEGVTGESLDHMLR